MIIFSDVQKFPARDWRLEVKDVKLVGDGASMYGLLP